MSKNNKLPELSEKNIGKLEDQIFQQIGAERVKKKRKLEIATYSIATVAVLSLVGGVGVPLLMNSQNTSETAISGDIGELVRSDSDNSFNGYLPSEALPGITGSKTDTEKPVFAPSMDDPELSIVPPETEISRNATAVIEVSDLNKAINYVRTEVAKLMGRISRLSYATDGNNSTSVNPEDDSDAYYGIGSDIRYYLYPDYGYTDTNTSYLSIKIPYVSLDEYLEDLNDIGKLVSLNVSEQDRSQEFTSLRKSQETTEKVLKRLRELLPEATNLSETLELEREIAYRETEIQWIQEEIDNVTDQVLMSSVTIELRQLDAAKANPNGFLDGVSKGWDSLVNGFNWMLIALGWVIPWAALIGVIWLIVALMRRGRAQKHEQ